MPALQICPLVHWGLHGAVCVVLFVMKKKIVFNVQKNPYIWHKQKSHQTPFWHNPVPGGQEPFGNWAEHWDTEVEPYIFWKKKQQQQQRVSNTVNNSKIPYVPEHRRHWNTQRRWEWRSRSARDCSDTWRCLAPRRPCTRPDWRLARMRVWWRRDTLALGTLCSQTAWLTRCTRTVLLDWLALAADPHTRHSNTF